MRASNSAGRLLVVPTPIGNLGDITVRSLEALEKSDSIYSEDTRVTGRLLRALGIDAARPLRLDENTLDAKAAEVAARVAAGETVAYCTDAGMPGVSDPGMRLVAAMREAGLAVEVLPGASAAACAYVASGFPATSYYFGGFFPRKDGERASLLRSLSSLDAALVFYESPNRIASALRFVAEAFPHRQVAVCRELTKLHEEIVVLPAPEAAGLFEERGREGRIKGEFAFVVDAPAGTERDEKAQAASEDAASEATRLVRGGLSRKAVAKELVSRFGIPRNEAYSMALAADAGEEPGGE